MAPRVEDVRAFQQVLLDHHYTVILRASKGSDILAACGQLSGREKDGNLEPESYVEGVQYGG